MLDRDEGRGRIHVGVRLVAHETPLPDTLGLAAPLPPGAQLGLSADAPPPITEEDLAEEAVDRLAAGRTGSLTDPTAGLDAPAAVAGSLAPPAPPVATLSYSALSAHGRCGYRFYLESVLRLPGTDRPPPPAVAREPPGLDPRARGSIAHLALEELDLRRPVVPSPAALQEMGARFDAEPTAAEAAEIAGLLGRFPRCFAPRRPPARRPSCPGRGAVRPPAAERRRAAAQRDRRRAG